MANQGQSADPVAGLEIDLLLIQAAGHRRDGAVGKAVQLYQQVLSRQPANPTALLGMSEAALETGAVDVAQGFAAKAAAAAPRAAGPAIALARVRLAQKRPQDAIGQCRKAIALGARTAAIHVLLGEAQLDASDRPAAAASFGKALAIDPGHQLAAHMLSALTDGEATPRNAYVRNLFDYYAGIFDTHLTATLGYDVPTRMRQLLDRVLPGQRFEAVLDLGCGTGLVAEALSGRIGAIDGADIAPAMIEAARARGVYRNLDAVELGDVLGRPASAAAYDLVTAADVFIYVGRLEQVFPGVARVLRPGGHFLFSVEQASDDVAVRSSGRFAHGRAYLDRLAHGAGLAPVAAQSVDIRTERGTPIAGHLLLYAKA